MAASDQNYRNQYTLDIVFAVSSTLMLASIILMFWQDYFREFKTEQRSFRDAEAGIAQRQALQQLPNKEEFDKLEAAVAKARKEQKNDEIDAAKKEMEAIQPKKERADAAYQDKKASFDSLIAFRNQYADEHGKKAGDEKYAAEIDSLTKKLADAKAVQDTYDEQLKVSQRKMSNLTKDLTDAESEWKRLNDRFETQAKLAITKKWGLADSIRDLPMFDFLAPSIKIHQFTINDVPINFNFTYVRRFDRCMTCHQGIDRPGYTKEMLESLKNPLQPSLRNPVDAFWTAVAAMSPTQKPEEVTRLTKAGWAKQILGVFLAGDWENVSLSGLSQYDAEAAKGLKGRWDEVVKVAKQDKVGKEPIADYLTQKRNLLEAQGLLEARIKTLGPTEGVAPRPTPDQLAINFMPDAALTPARIKEFCGHPRQDLFVGANSKHPAEKFGCTSCHQGQGAGTTFNGSFHSPNTSETKNAWTQEHDFGKDTHTYLWDFPMLPSRFIESSCLKCHHQVTDLYGPQNRNEAPKLLKGYHLLQESGCYGCHEIQGRKGGRQVGPDMRLESNPPLELLTPAEQDKIKKDVDNAPGTMRKVGPSLYRIAEKTNREWTARWLKGPREFRPDTKMPHFYGLANNDKSVLPEHQKDFPDAEIQAITHYLFTASDAFLKEIAELHKDGKEAGESQLLDEMLAKPAANRTIAEKEELPKLQMRVRKRKSPLLEDLAKDYKGDPVAGRQLFSERGCLACHGHKGTEAAPLVPSSDLSFAPKVVSEANFGPDLSQLVDKLGKHPGDKDSARKWLVQWIIDPHVYSRRARMPVTHLTVNQAADVAAWLLSQKAVNLGDGWAATNVAEPSLEKLKSLAEVYFVRLLPAGVMKDLLDGNKKVDRAALVDLPEDEIKLASDGITSDSLKYYLGKKAVGRLGCFGCHDVPAYDTAKPIGVGLLDWGKKDPERLAFEDIQGYVEKHYYSVPSLKDKDGKPYGEQVKDGVKKMPYEAFFADALGNQQREGFLHQKLVEPRSYDYNRILAWDDRSRMPQFKFARSRMKDGESKEQFEARTLVEEAEAREAVMTFILGLVAEPVPLKSINEPSGDRLAEVKGRQVLEKYNCAGCHLIEPGVFDFKVSKPGSILLDASYDLASRTKDHVFRNHYNWVGKTPETPDRLVAPGVAPQLRSYKRKLLLDEGELDEWDLTDPDSAAKAKSDSLDVVYMRLGHALRFQTAHTTRKFLSDALDREQKKSADDKDESVIKDLTKKLKQQDELDRTFGDYRDITASNYVRVPAADMIYPPPAVFASRESMHRLKDLGPLGGTFSDILLNYLVAKDKGKSTEFYKLDQQGDSNYARAAGPPSLVGQGERTQSAWLNQFLLDPQPIRRMAVLRMPKFNMSPAEADALVAYFTAVSRLQNTGTSLENNEVIPQQQDFDSAYWKKKNEDYVARLKAQKTDKGKSRYDERMEFLQPYLDGKLEVGLEASSKRVATAQEALDVAKKALSQAKDVEKADKERNVAAKEKMLADAKDNELAWKEEVRKQNNGPKGLDREAKLKAWNEKDAYLADSYKMVTQICLKCHQVGQLGSALKIADEAQGPALQEVHKRIRPGWAEHWIAAPPRMIPYSAVMPVNFELGKNDWQDRMAGTSLQQVIAARDLLMVLPRIEAMPINRYWALSLPGLTTPEQK